MRSVLAAGVLATGVVALGLGGTARAASGEEWFTCPDSAQIDPRRDRDRDPPKVREIAPTAGARTSQDLAALGAMPGLAYDLYDVFDAGGDLNAAFAGSGLRLVGFIYGRPGVDTERRGPRRAERNAETLYGFVADDVAANRRVIVFRGTLQPNEWVRNLQVRQRPLPDAPGANVHAGFHAIYESLTLVEGGVATPFAAALPRLSGGGAAPVFVGHSLGSALATLAGVDASRRAPEAAGRIRIATFASPRVGDAGFAALAQGVGRIDRVCNVVDVVTAVPPSTRTIGYQHVGQVFPISSFDWPSLNNNTENAGDQVLCWHSDALYAFMISPRKDAAPAGVCVK